MITREQIDRINELARRKKTVGLTPAETAEREELKRLYAAAFRDSLRDTLDHTVVVEPDGTRRPLKKE